jgi:hypothetical protein
MALQALSDDDCEIVRACLDAIVNGPFVADEDFTRLCGVERSDAERVLSAWPHTSDAALQDLTVRNALHLVATSVVDQQNPAWSDWIPVDRAHVESVLVLWLSPRRHEPLADRVRRAGIEAVAAQYFEASRSQDKEMSWIVDALWDDRELDDETHFRLVLTLLEHAETDRDYWLIGDGPVETGLWPRAGMVDRLRIERARNPKVQRLDQVMTDYFNNVISRAPTENRWLG